MDRRPMRRRGGRPNRGGGRGSRGNAPGRRGQARRGGNAQGRSRGGGSGFQRKGLDEMYDLEDRPLDGLPEPRQHQGIRQECIPRPSYPKVKVSMQRLHMSTENQEMVRDMLRNLHGEEIDIPSEDEYDELDYRSEEHYWMSDNALQIEDHSNYSSELKAVNPFAVQRLVRCGFDKELCVEALQVCNEDIGASLEKLLSQCFLIQLGETSDESAEEISPGHKETSKCWQEILDARSEEMTALQSIYEEKFEERIQNRVWLLFLDLQHLIDMIQPKSTKPRSSKPTINIKNLCKYFQKGSCRFGERCRFRHVKPVDIEESQAEGKYENAFQLEVRFPEGNRYPHEPPLLAFSSTYPFMPTQSCLNISKYLYNKAKTLSENHEPAIFTLMGLLENASILKELLEQPPLEQSLPRPIISLGHYRETVQKEKELSSIYRGNVDDNTGEIYARQMVSMTEKDSCRQNSNDNGEEEIVPVQKYCRKGDVRKKVSRSVLLRQNKSLKEEFKRKQSTSLYQRMKEQRSKLPVWDFQELITETVRKNQVVIISGMTGCGKTTQIPQFILDAHLNSTDGDMCNIVCTQPRRISTISVAQRVADERADKLGRIVGYQIRLESVQSSQTRLLFCTTGIILRQLEGDPVLEGITHLIIDEIHERSVDSDFLLLILRGLMSVRPDLRMILMSATLNAMLFSEYFWDCPVIEIPGRTYPVDQYFLEDAIDFTRFVMEENSPFSKPVKRLNVVQQGGQRHSGMVTEDVQDELGSEFNEKTLKVVKDSVPDDNLTVKQLCHRYSGYSKSTIKTLALMDFEKINFDLILALLEWIVSGKHDYPQDGAILVFLPGFAEIQSLYDMLQSSSEFGFRSKSRYKIIPLHSTLSSEDQKAVFLKPKEGVTKIVIATNIAETSITIDDVVFVIDAGRLKEKRYDSSKGMESLDMVWVYRANALQRKGRAGRVASGVCFHLFTSHHFEHRLRDQPIPEIQRVPLEQICLRIKMLDIFQKQPITDVLANIMEPPQHDAVTSAIRRLQELGAFDENVELTSLGYHLGSLPVDVRIGKLMLFGAIFRCLDAALTIAAMLSFKSPFVSPFDKRDEADKKKLEFAVGNSDHLTMLNAYKCWIEARVKGSREAYTFCQENFLSIKSLQMLASLKQQFVELLSDIGFVKESLTLRDMERAARNGGDGVVSATGPEANVNSSNWKLVSAILVAALYPNVVQVMTPETRYGQSTAGTVVKAPKPEEIKFKTKMNGYVSIHPSSVNFQVRHYESPYLVYHEKVKTSKVYIRDCTMVSVYPLLLFVGGKISVDLERGNFVLSVDDGWIRFMAGSHEIAELVRELKLELNQILSDKIRNPNMDLCTCPRGSRIIDTIVRLITTQ